MSPHGTGPLSGLKEVHMQAASRSLSVIDGGRKPDKRTARIEAVMEAIVVMDDVVTTALQLRERALRNKAELLRLLPDLGGDAA